jgi:TDG/mug DNA glycosylase family protein
VRRPTKEEVAAAAGQTIPDVIADDLDVLFCGINPGLYTAAVGCHFGRPGNRFWPTLYRAGFTPRLFIPDEQGELLRYGCGITNLVARATAAAAELTAEELEEGARILERKVRRYRPRVLAVVGIGAYRTAFARPRAKLGLQPETIGETAIWILPNPSGLNANYRPAELAALFRELREGVTRAAGKRRSDPIPRRRVPSHRGRFSFCLRGGGSINVVCGRRRDAPSRSDYDQRMVEMCEQLAIAGELLITAADHPRYMPLAAQEERSGDRAKSHEALVPSNPGDQPAHPPTPCLTNGCRFHAR